MNNTGCNHYNFADAVAYADKKRTGGAISIDGGFDKAFAYARQGLEMKPVAAGVVPGGQKAK